MTIAALPDLLRDWNADNAAGSDGDPVASLPDASANTVPATQATADRYPLLAAAAVNGHAALTFDGTDDYLTDASYPQNWGDSLTWHIVAKPTLGVPGILLGGQRQYPSSLVIAILGYGDSGLIQAKAGTVQIAKSTTATTADWHIYTVTMAGAGSASTVTVYQDGVEMASGTGGNVAGDWPGVRIGAEYYQTAGQFADPYAGQIARVVCCSTVHDAAGLNADLAELGTDYGISVSEIGGGGSTPQTVHTWNGSTWTDAIAHTWNGTSWD